MDGSNDKISCMGIIGDGCGGGREFIVQDNTLSSYDPYTEKSLVLLENITDAKSISKHRCILTIECEDQTLRVDLSEINIEIK